MKTNKREKGISLIFFLLLLPIILMAIAAAINLGWLAIARTQAQAAVDAAALSAAGAIPHYRLSNGDSSGVLELARLFNQTLPVSEMTTANMIIGKEPAIADDPASVSIGVWNKDAVNPAPKFSLLPPGAPLKEINAVRVTHQFEAPLFFANILGLGSSTMTMREVRATAAIGGPWCGVSVIPLMLCSVSGVLDTCGDESACNSVLDFGKASNNTTDNAAWFATCPPGTGESQKSLCNAEKNAADIVNALRSGEKPDELCVGSKIVQDNGEKTAVLHELSKDEYLDTMFILPVVDCGPQLNKVAEVKAFVAVKIETVTDSGGGKKVRFRRLCGVNIQGPTAGGIECGGSLLSGPSLVE